jgi:hypothetical protein
MTDESLDRLGDYFVHWRVAERFNITFERFLYLHQTGAWRWIV